MRFTHPVNTLKKLGCSLAFGAAAIMAMRLRHSPAPRSTWAQADGDGNTYYGRSEDYGPRYLKHFGIEPSHGPGHTYSSDESSFMYTSTKTTYRYTYVRDHPSQWDNRWGCLL